MQARDIDGAADLAFVAAMKQRSQTVAEQLRALGAVVEAESVRFRLARLRYESGVASYLDLLDAQRALFTAQTTLVQSRLASLQNQVQLYRSLGGGWTE